MNPLVCVFAHPDDEAFGPSGSIAKFSKERDVYIICVTNGDAGKNSSSETAELGEIRKKELLNSAKILGVKKVFFLGYKDGSLCNNLYHEIAGKIQDILEEVKPETLLTFDLGGISGHIDHIAVAMITSFLFGKLEFINRLLYYGERFEVLDAQEDYFIFMPPGYKKEAADLIVNIEEVWNIKVQAMQAHVSQTHDAEKLLKIFSKYPKEELFKVRSKK